MILIFIASGWFCWKMALTTCTINKNEQKKWKDTSQCLEIRIVVAACKWETSDGSMHINSVNFVCKCNFSKFCCFWVLGPLLQKVLVEGTPPIVGECVCICIESFKILWQNLWYSTLKKRYTFFLNFPHNHLQCLAMVLFKGWKIPKNNGMNGLIGYLESMVQFEPKRR